MKIVFRELSCVVLLFVFWTFALAARQLPVMDGLEMPKSGDITLLIGGIAAYAAGALSMWKPR